MAVVMATKVFAPYIWGSLSDRWGRRLSIIRWLTALGAVAFTLMFIRQDYFWMLMALGVFSFFWHAALPQFEVFTLDHLGPRRTRYSRIRLWGSIGFIISVAGIGYWLESGSIQILPIIVAALLAATWLTTLFVSEVPHPPQPANTGSVIAILRQPAVLAFFMACLLMQASHGPYYTFFSIYLGEQGYSTVAIGLLWALGVLAEIGVFLAVHHWLQVTGAAKLFSIAIAITAARWLLIGSLVDHLPVLIIAQIMHAASYGLFHASAMELLQRFFPGRLQGRGQALYTGIGFGIGNSLGSLFAGYVWSGFGSAWAYYFGSIMSLLALALSWIVYASQQKRHIGADESGTEPGVGGSGDDC